VSLKLKRLSGVEVLSIFHGLGFCSVSRRGSHVKLRRVSDAGAKQTLTIPVHNELDAGTLKAIIRQASRYVPESKLRPFFYSD